MPPKHTTSLNFYLIKKEIKSIKGEILYSIFCQDKNSDTVHQDEKTINSLFPKHFRDRFKRRPSQ